MKKIISSKKKNPIAKKKYARLLAMVLGGCLMTGNVFAADLAAVASSDYTNSQVGKVTGSRVTTHVDADPSAGVIKELNGDAGLYAINENGESKLVLRQYTYSTTELKPNRVLDVNGDWNNPDQTGVIKAVANMHAAASNGKYLFATGYDLGQIGVAEIAGGSLKDQPSLTVNLKNCINDNCSAGYGAKTTVHGEGIAVRGDKLYLVASVNLEGGYDNYDNGYLLQFNIKDNGSLEFNSYTRVGKNADQVRLSFYNDSVFIPFIGGMQNYGAGNAESRIDVVKISNGQLNTISQAIKKPENVKCDFRNLKILPNGTAYVMTYNLAATGSGMDAHVYKTTVSNLMSENPKNWEEIVSGQYEGWFGKLDAEYYTKRLWLEAGDKLQVYTDGSTKPIVWNAKDFSTDEQYSLFNAVEIIPTDTVNGELAQLKFMADEGLTQSSQTLNKRVNLNATSNSGDYKSSITGTASDVQYNAVTNDNSHYHFDADKTINLGLEKSGGNLDNNILADIYANDGNDIVIDASANTLQLQAKNYIGTPVGIFAGNGKNVSIDAGKLNIITSGYQGGNSLTNAIWNDAGKDKTSTIEINAPVNISMSDGLGGNGIAIQKTDRWGEKSNEANDSSKVIIHGDVSILGADNTVWGIPINGENVYSRFNNAGILTAVDKSEVVIDGNVDFAVYGNGVTTNAKDSKVSINGGKIVAPSSTQYGYYALSSYLGAINMNTGIDGKTVGSNTVKLDGDLFALNTGTINLALINNNSYLNGIIDNGGTANLYLQNGATWYNAKQNNRYADDNEDIGAGQISHVSRLTGGNTPQNRGVIYQKDSNPITIDRYSGNTLAWYDHNTSSPAEIIGGAIHIKSADLDSTMTLWTGNNGINTADSATDNEKAILNTVFDNLAKKLVYEGYKGKVENNLKGTVGIAEGMTFSSALKSGDIAFSEITGEGSYQSASTPSIPTEQVTTSFTTTLTGLKDNDIQYVNGGVVQKNGTGQEEYRLTKDSTITVDDQNVTASNIGYYPAVVGILGNGNDITVVADGKSLDLDCVSTTGTSQAIGVYANKNVNVQANNLSIKATAAGKTAAGIFVQNGGQAVINGNVDMSVKNSTDGDADGIYLYNGGSKLTINGDLNMKGSGEGDLAYGVLAAQKGGYGTKVYQAKGIYMYDNSTDGGEVKITGKADIAVKGTGIDMRGSKNNKITIDNGSIITPESTTDEVKAVGIAAGTFNMGMTDQGIANGKDVTVKGQIYALDKGTINLGLGSSNSLFAGVVSNTNGGSVNLFLEKGATWENTLNSKSATFNGSHVNTISGGKTKQNQGVISQKDSNPITIDKYSGYTTVLYGHDKTTPTNIIGGNLTINSALGDSFITLRTDNVGLNTDSDKANDKNLVSETLNALANKLYYTAYANGEKNLSGMVEIAEGLTAASASKKSGSITYKTDGQGQYEYTQAVDAPKTDPITKSMTLTDNYEAIATVANAYGDKYVSALFNGSESTSKQNPMVIDMAGHNLTLKSQSPDKIAAGMFVSANDYINVKNNDATKKLSISSTINDTRGAMGIQLDGNSHLSISGAVDIDGVSTKGDSVTGIHIQGQNSDVKIDGPLTIKNITAKRERGNGINASGIRVTGDNSNVTVNDIVDITGVRGNGLNTVGADSSISVKGGTITAAEDADKSKLFYAIRVDKGTVNVNMNGQNAGNTTTKINGDVFVNKEYGKRVVEYSGGELVDFTKNGNLNLALTDNQSFWTGVAGYSIDKSDYGTGGFTAHDAGDFNLYLQNGATWTNQQQSSVKQQTNNEATFSGSKVTKLTGGTDKDHAGLIFQKDNRDITVDNYNGNMKVFYEHELSTPTTMIGGNIKINHAATDSGIIFSTDNAGVTNENSNAVLNALANKLYYNAYISGERNLIGQAEITEGLTSSAKALKLVDMTFNETTGQGEYKVPVIPDNQTETEFTRAITGNKETNSEYVDSGVLKENGTYSFTKDTTINAEKNLIAAGAWMPKISSAISGSTEATSVLLDMNNKDLIINTTTDTHTTGITAIGDGKVEIDHAGKITINTESTGGGQTAALYTNGGGHIVIHNGGENLEDKVLTVRANTTSIANGAVIKSMNGVGGKESSIIIDGLVDVVADGNGDAKNEKGANEGISAVASTIEIGGGSIKAVNGAWCAIRAYGEFVSNNYGTVNINVAKDEQGNIIGAGKNKTTIEGAIVTNGGMGTKGRVSIGLSTSDSYWKGDYTDVTGYGVTQGQLGNVNLFMTNGANWTGYTKGTMNVDMSSGATWEGYNVGDNFNLSLSDQAIWKNNNKTENPSKVQYLTGAKDKNKIGYIQMTQDATANLVIDNYSGNTLAWYDHNTASPTELIGGSITVKSAAPDSTMTLWTGNNGVNTATSATDAEKETLNTVLDNLAKKLIYTGYIGKAEENLKGYVGIAEGMTSSSAIKNSEIKFSETTGEGSYEHQITPPTPPIPPVIPSEFNTPIGKDNANDEYKDVMDDTGRTYTFTKDTKVDVDDTKQVADGVTAAVYSNNKDTIINAEGKNIVLDANGTANKSYGIAATAENSNINVNASNVTIHTSGSNESSGIYSDQGNVSIINNISVHAKNGNGILAKDNGKVTINGDADITVDENNAQAVWASAGTVEIKGDTTINAVNKTALLAEAGGQIKLDTTNKRVNITGDIENHGGSIAIVPGEDSVIKGAIRNTSGNVEISLGKGSVLEGGIETGSTQKTFSMMRNVSAEPITKLSLVDGAIWRFNADKDANVSDLVGGSKGHEGIIEQKSAHAITAHTFNGNMNVKYASTYADGNLMINDNQGNFVINGLKASSSNNSITISTDNNNVNALDNTSWEKTLNSLANKVQYNGVINEDGRVSNLTGMATVNESITAPSAKAEILFKNGTDSNIIDKITFNNGSSGTITYGDYETAVMSGVKSAMTSAAMGWRTENNNLMKRMGDLRLSSGDVGAWARIYRGKSSSDKNKTDYKANYNTVQVGYDKEVDGNWRVGTAISIMEGDSSYQYGGSGDDKSKSIALYGTWNGEKGHYADLILKGTKLTNDYTVFNADGHQVEGDYDTWGTSISAEYGRRIKQDNGFYYEPQLEFTYGHLNGSDYDATSDFMDVNGKYKTMNVNQSSMNSLIGRIGIAFGREMEKSSVYAQLSYSHEFCGDMNTYYDADNMPKSTKQDFKDSWVTFMLGGTSQLNDKLYAYGNFEKSIGGDIKTDWRIDAGLRWSF